MVGKTRTVVSCKVCDRGAVAEPPPPPSRSANTKATRPDAARDTRIAGDFEARKQKQRLEIVQSAVYKFKKSSFRNLSQRNLNLTLDFYNHDLARQFNPILNWIAFIVLNFGAVLSRH